jgi:hypothetical protein
VRVGVGTWRICRIKRHLAREGPRFRIPLAPTASLVRTVIEAISVAPIEAHARFRREATDPLLEQTGFEPSVPRKGCPSQPRKLLHRAEMQDDEDERNERQEPEDPGQESPPSRRLTMLRKVNRGRAICCPESGERSAQRFARCCGAVSSGCQPKTRFKCSMIGCKALAV